VRIREGCSTVAVSSRIGWTSALAAAFTFISCSSSFKGTKRPGMIFSALLGTDDTQEMYTLVGLTSTRSTYVFAVAFRKGYVGTAHKILVLAQVGDEDVSHTAPQDYPLVLSRHSQPTWGRHLQRSIYHPLLTMAVPYRPAVREWRRTGVE
jgi:hypothetical protein